MFYPAFRTILVKMASHYTGIKPVMYNHSMSDPVDLYLAMGTIIIPHISARGGNCCTLPCMEIFVTATGKPIQ